MAKMKTFELAAGSRALIAAPSNPMPKEISDALATMVAGYSGVVEAHLPYCFIPEAMDEASQVLVLVLDATAQRKEILKSIEIRLLDILPSDSELFLIPLNKTSPLCASVRSVKCQIYQSPNSSAK